MIYVLYVALGLVGLAALVNLIWRILSRRRELPCPSWLGWMVELDNPLTRVNRAQFIVDHLGLEPGMKVLDAGCGPGRVTLPLAEAVGPQGEVVALDVQDKMLARVCAKAEASDLANIRCLQAGLGQGDLPLDSFDRAVLVSVLGEIPNQMAALTEIYDVLKPGGILSITEVIFDPHFQRRKNVRRLAQAAGFTEKAFLGKRLAYTMRVEKPKGERVAAED
ncbi:MAG: methyltransferase domain-containing protein [Anaerolineae bacterium]|jgi:ubiquinone/menaquinone biosynthesis C-methylase UbiE